MSEEKLALLAEDLDSIREEVLSDLGEIDAAYIRKILRFQRVSEILGRGLLFFGFNPIAWGGGVAFLSLSKILDNMEIGHNVMHGQFDWMNDPILNSRTFEWDTACEGKSWKQTHNFEHHSYTNILNKDRDFGYGFLRLSPEQKWSPRHRYQFLQYLLLSLNFQWGVALNELDIEKVREKKMRWRDKVPFLKGFFKKGSKQLFKDYVFFPLVAGPSAVPVFLGNLAANGIRNVWSATVIFCGHFPDGTQTFLEEEVENESRGHWYYRQMVGSANFRGSKLLHILSGHLSCQIEHHLFPALPAHRYPEIAQKVEAVAKKHQIPYNTGSFWAQYKTVVNRILEFSRPPALSA